VKLIAALSFAFLLAAPSAFAQADPEESGLRLRVGPVTVQPSLAITNLGVDSNVFNSVNPQSDFTMTVTPKADLSMRLGRARLTGAVKEDLVYFRKFANERSANTSFRGGVALPLTRVTLSFGSEARNLRDRPGFEIDARSQRSERAHTAAAEIRAFGKTFVALSGSRSTVRFDRDAAYFGSSLARELNRTMTAAGVALRYQATPVTAVVVKLDRQQDRFEFSPIRDSNSTRILGGLQFDPFGLISGSATFGYRQFEPSSSIVPGYKGGVINVNVAYRASGSMRLGVQAGRDIQYSYDIDQPYYVQTGVEGSVQRQITGPFDATGRIGAQRLAYRGRIGASVPPDRADIIHVVGLGLGYRMGRAMRIGFDVDRQHRTSDLLTHGYSGLRYGTSVTYGF
jgi:hypothetical protein